MSKGNLKLLKSFKFSINIILVLWQIIGSFGDESPNGVCPSLFSSTSTIIKCEYNGKPLENCENATDGTTALLSCNSFYEDVNLEQNPIRLCKDGKWNPSISQCSPICGLTPSKGTSTIINGQSSPSSDYPWHVGIYNDKKDLICGGTIISSKIVLSAAHCVTNYDDGDVKTENYYVGAGKYYHEYGDKRDAFAQYSQIQEIHVPPAFKGTRTHYSFDIAILVLSNPFSFSTVIQPVCLELPVEIFEKKFLLHNDSIGIVTGWGYIKPEGPLSEVLKELILPYVLFVKCLEEVPTSFMKFVTYDKLCGGYLNNGTGVCSGDGGGGFIFKNPLNNRYYIKGILSAAPASEASQCDINQYATYTSVSSHIDFIQDTIIANNGV